MTGDARRGGDQVDGELVDQGGVDTGSGAPDAVGSDAVGSDAVGSDAVGSDAVGSDVVESEVAVVGRVEGADVGAAGPRPWWARAWSAPLVVHALVLAAVLLGSALLVGANGFFSTDEAAPLLQARLLHEGRGWTVDHPLPELDPQGQRFFLSSFTDGGPRTFAPYGKHPLYPVVLVPVTALGGALGAMLLSAVATVVAALAAARLAAWSRPELARPALWVTGLASPLFFDAHLVIAHALGAACAGWLVWHALRAVDTTGAARWVRLAAASVLTAVAVLLRTEATLFALAVAVVLGVGGLRRRVWVRVGAAAAVGVTALATFRLELVWFSRNLGTQFGPAVAGVGRDDYLTGRVQATIWTLLAPTGASAGPIALVAVVVGVLVVVAGLVIRRRGDWEMGSRLLVLAAAAAVLGVVLSPDAVSGILAAFPLLTLGLVLLRRTDLGRPPLADLAAICLVFTALVLATTYSFGGAAEWGGRFLALALPLVVPVVLAPLARTFEPARARGRVRTALVALVVLSLAMSLIGWRELVQSHDQDPPVVDALVSLVRSDDLRASGADLGNGDRRPIVLSESAGLGRRAWDHYDEMRGLVVPAADLAPVLEQLTARGGDRVVRYTVDLARDRDVAAGLGWSTAREVDLGGGTGFLVLQRGS